MHVRTPTSHALFSFLLCLMFAFAAGDVSALTVLRGPYLQMVTSNSITVRWRTDVPTDSTVRFGTNAGLLLSLISDTSVTTEHEVQLAGLDPDTRYFYAIGSSNGELVSGPELHLRTAPVSPRPTRIWVIGDTRRTIEYAEGDSRAQVRDTFLNYSSPRAADLCFNTGDMGDSGYDHEFQTALFDVYAGIFRNTPAVVCLGNHDLGVQGGQPWLDAFSQPTNAEAGGVASGTERYYSFNYSGIHFVVLDCYGTNGIFTGQLDPSYRDKQLAWLQQDLQSNTQRWLIAMFHSPPYTWGSHNSDWEWDQITVRTWFVPVLEQYGADLLLNGHSHNYERSCLLRGHYGISSTLTAAMKLNSGNGRPGSDGAYYKTNAQSGTVYVVMGCSAFLGPGVYGHPAMVYSANELGSLVVDIDDNALQARFLRDSGAIDDYFVIVKGTNPPPTRMLAARLDGGTIRLRWETIEGYRYRVYRRSTVDGSRQQVSDDLTATGFALEWAESVAPTSSTAFYQVETVAE